MKSMGLQGVVRGKRKRTTISDIASGAVGTPRPHKASGAVGTPRPHKASGAVGTPRPHKATPCPQDKVNRQFAADRPNKLWLSDFTYVATATGFAYVAFVIDAFARRIVGWKVSGTATAAFVLDALNQAIQARRPVEGGLIHHSAPAAASWPRLLRRSDQGPAGP